MSKSSKLNAKIFAFLTSVFILTIILNAGEVIESDASTQPTDETVRATETVQQKDLFDVTTCGPATVGIVLRLYGREASLREIGRETWIDAEHRTTVKSLSHALTNRGIYARGRKLKLEELQKQRFPAIILAQSPSYAKGENHFLVYVGSDENSIKLLDPLGFTALKAVPTEVFQKEWTGVAIVTQLIPFKGLEKSRSRKWNILMVASIFLLLITLVTVSSSIRDKISLKKRCFDTGSTRILICVVCVVLGLGFVGLGLGFWWVTSSARSRPEHDNSRVAEGVLTKSNIVFQVNRIDLGEHFAESAPFTAKFPFRNVGDSCIELTAESCCGTHVNFKDNKVLYAPDETGEVILKILGPGPRQQRQVAKSITVLQKGKDVPVAKLEAVLSVKYHWRVLPFQLKYGKLKPGETINTDLIIEAGTDDEQGAVRSVKVSSPFLSVKRIDQDMLNKCSRYKYQVSLTGGKVARYFRTDIVFQTTTSKVPEIVVPITAEFTGMITVLPRSLYFGKVLSQSAVNKSLRIVSNNDEPIEIISTSSKNEHVSLVNIRPAKTANKINLDFIFKVPSNAKGFLRGTISILCKTSEEFEINVPWVAIVTLPEVDRVFSRPRQSEIQ